jgi:hypothetical protein
MKTTKIGDTVRQGDVLLVRVGEKEITAQHKEVPRENGAVVLALGESSMHQHVFRDPGVCMLRSEGIGDAVVTVKELCDLITEGGEIAPGRPRHDPVPVPPGTYRLVVQREWAGEEVRTVVD